eukprot:423521-Pleurochrysis_carterae.AAC.6
MGHQASASSAWRAQPLKHFLQQGKAGFLRGAQNHAGPLEAARTVLICSDRQVPAHATAKHATLKVAACLEAVTSMSRDEAQGLSLSSGGKVCERSLLGTARMLIDRN